MRASTFLSELWLPLPPQEVFPFFAEARNLQEITPPWLSFRVLSQRPRSMGQGTVIDYRLRLHGVPLRWRSEITVWEPPHRFVDVQRRGPYRLWEHDHLFLPHDGGTLVRDRVRYAVPGGPLLAPLLDRLLVRPDLERIFAYRRRRLLELLGGG
ncbi:MAG TPA: SRPBCC family protein [Dehalococcoidia bacterium]|nr:SRPBCC family protein [Dehalococcoidia bacterium]